MISRGAAGLEADTLELARDILHRFSIALFANLAPFKLIVGEESDVRPPAIALRRVIGREERRRRDKKNGRSFH